MCRLFNFLFVVMGNCCERDGLVVIDSEIHAILDFGWMVDFLHMRCQFLRFYPLEIVDVYLIDSNHLYIFQLVYKPSASYLEFLVYFQGQDLYANKAVRDKQIVRVLGKVRFIWDVSVVVLFSDCFYILYLLTRGCGML